MAKMPVDFGSGINVSASSRIQLTASTAYTCPSDGYFRIYTPKALNNYALGYVNDSLLMAISSAETGNMKYDLMSSIPVKKGMVIKYDGTTGSTGYFYPFS